MRHAAPRRRHPLHSRLAVSDPDRRRAWRALTAGLVVVAMALTLVPRIGASSVASADASPGGEGQQVLGVASPPGPAVASTPEPDQTLVPTTRGPLGSGEAVTIAFGGDSHFETYVGERLRREGSAMFASLEPLFAGSDLQVLNLETAITERGEPVAKEWTFRAPPSALDALAEAGIDAVSMANNHGIDFGEEGLADSLAARAAAPLAVLGIGVDATDAYAPLLTEVRGQRIAVIGATQVLDDFLIPIWTATDTRAGLASAKEVDRLVQAVREARAVADTVVVYLHWGREKTTCPTDVQQGLAPILLEAGADILVGGHAHRVQGAGRMGEGFVAYGLGNFIWFNEMEENGDTGALLVTATGRHIDGYEWRPARIRNGVAAMSEGAERDAALARWEERRACTGLTP